MQLLNGQISGTKHVDFVVSIGGLVYKVILAEGNKKNFSVLFLVDSDQVAHVATLTLSEQPPAYI